MREVLHRIPELAGAISITPILKGFSKEEKWKIEHVEKTYFVKVGAVETAKQRKVELHYVQHFYKQGVPVPKLIRFDEMESICIEVSAFIEGEDGKEILPRMSWQEQYRCGKQAGKALLQIHSLVKSNNERTWEEYRISKHERYTKRYQELNLSLVPIEDALDFIDNHKQLLKNRPIVFLHDDFHPSNLILTANKLEAVIDFGRYEWGDPYHDFYKIALFTRNVSPAFATGQIHGYFDGEPPQEFWMYYALYAAFAVVADVEWSFVHTPHLLAETKQRLMTILQDHHDFKQCMPQWYIQELQTFKSELGNKF
jgi:aminoglycoside phosphotransferase (APT) family kinase protein